MTNRDLMILGPIVVVAVLAWMGRYEVTPIQHGDRGYGLVLDRWTGSFFFCPGDECR